MIEEFQLAGRMALVIGAAGGLGLQQAVGLARAGASVALADRNAGGLAATREEVERAGGTVRIFPVDITDARAVDALAQDVAGAFGKIDILVNSAGITQRTPSEDYDEAMFERILDINLNGVFYACQAVGKIMIRQGGGRIINMGSIFSTVGVAESPAYAVSKGAVVQLTRALAVEWAADRVAVNAILPSWFDTAMGNVVAERERFYQGAAKLPSSQDLEARTVGRVPLGRLGKTREIVGATVFLASDAASMVTGHLLAVDGGFLAQ